MCATTRLKGPLALLLQLLPQAQGTAAGSCYAAGSVAGQAGSSSTTAGPCCCSPAAGSLQGLAGAADHCTEHIICGEAAVLLQGTTAAGRLPPAPCCCSCAAGCCQGSPAVQQVRVLSGLPLLSMRMCVAVSFRDCAETIEASYTTGQMGLSEARVLAARDRLLFSQVCLCNEVALFFDCGMQVPTAAAVCCCAAVHAARQTSKATAAAAG